MTAVSSSSIGGVGERWGRLVGELLEAVQLVGVVLADGGRELGRVRIGGQEHGLEVGELAQLIGDALEPLPVGDEHLRPRVLQAVDDLLGLPPPVEPDEDRPARHRGPEREAPLRVVLAQHGDAVATGDAEPVAQRMPGAVRSREEPFEAPLVVAVCKKRRVAPWHRQLCHRAQMGQPLRVHLQFHPVDHLGGDLEHGPRRSQLRSRFLDRRHPPILPDPARRRRELVDHGLSEVVCPEPRRPIRSSSVRTFLIGPDVRSVRDRFGRLRSGRGHRWTSHRPQGRVAPRSPCPRIAVQPPARLPRAASRLDRVLRPPVAGAARPRRIAAAGRSRRPRPA